MCRTVNRSSLGVSALANIARQKGLRRIGGDAAILLRHRRAGMNPGAYQRIWEARRLAALCAAAHKAWWRIVSIIDDEQNHGRSSSRFADALQRRVRRLSNCPQVGGSRRRRKGTLRRTARE